METTFHMTAEAPARSRFESFRPSAIAKPQKAFAVAFAVLTAALAGCASGLGANTHDTASAGRVARVEEGAVIAARPITLAADAQPGFAYTIRLPSGELVSVVQAGDFAMRTGTPVLVEYGPRARVIPQQVV